MYGKEAWSAYRLTARDLALLQHRLVPNPLGLGFGPVRQYSKLVRHDFAGVVWFTFLESSGYTAYLQVLVAAAKRKWGTLEAFTNYNNTLLGAKRKRESKAQALCLDLSLCTHQEKHVVKHVVKLSIA